MYYYSESQSKGSWLLLTLCFSWLKALALRGVLFICETGGNRSQSIKGTIQYAGQTFANYLNSTELFESIMYGKTEGSASPNAHAVFRAWRPTPNGPPHSSEPESSRGVLSTALPDAKKCSGPRAEEGQGSKRHHWFWTPTRVVLRWA